MSGRQSSRGALRAVEAVEEVITSILAMPYHHVLPYYSHTLPYQVVERVEDLGLGEARGEGEVRERGALHCTALYYTALNCTTLQCAALHILVMHLI